MLSRQPDAIENKETIQQQIALQYSTKAKSFEYYITSSTARMTPLEEMKKNLIGGRSEIPFDEDDNATANWNATVVSGHTRDSVVTAMVANDKPWCSGFVKECICNGSRCKKGGASSARRSCSILFSRDDYSVMDTIDSSSRLSNLLGTYVRNEVKNDDDAAAATNVTSSWMCGSGFFMDAILHRDDVDTKECEGPTARETMLRNMQKCSSGGRKDDISAIHLGTTNSSETELTDLIKQLMEDSARTRSIPSNKSLAEKLEAVKRSRNYREQQNNSHGERNSFWKGDGVWSSDQTTVLGSALSSTQHLPEVNSEQRGYIQARAEAGWRPEADRHHEARQVANLRTNEVMKQVTVTRRADIGKAYVQVQQEKVASKSSFWQGDRVWSSDQSTAFESAPYSPYLRPHVSEYDEAVASSRHLSFNDNSTEKQSNCWRTAIDVSSGRTYYYNTETNQSSWSLPSDDERRQTLRQKQLGCEVHHDHVEEKREERHQYWVSQSQSQSQTEHQNQSRWFVSQEDGKKKKTSSRLRGFSPFRKKRSERSRSTSSSSPRRLTSHKLTTVRPDPASPGGTADTSLSSSFDYQQKDRYNDAVVTRFAC